MSGAIFVPVCPTWSVCGRQPASSRPASSRRRRRAAPASSSSDGEALRRADPAAAGDDDLRVGQRDAACRAPTRLVTRTTRSASVELRRERLDAAGSAPAGVRPRPRAARRSAARTGACSRASSRRLPPQRTRVTSAGSPRRDGDAVGGQRQVEPRGDVGHDLVAALGARRRRRPSRRAARSRSTIAARPRRRRVRSETRRRSATWTCRRRAPPSCAAARVRREPISSACTGSAERAGER